MPPRRDTFSPRLPLQAPAFRRQTRSFLRKSHTVILVQNQHFGRGGNDGGNGNPAFLPFGKRLRMTDVQVLYAEFFGDFVGVLIRFCAEFNLFFHRGHKQLIIRVLIHTPTFLYHFLLCLPFCPNFPLIFCKITPRVGFSNREISRSKVVFPHPFSPNNTVLEPFKISKATPFRITRSFTESATSERENTGCPPQNTAQESDISTDCSLR